jgi:hypothetical protein
MRNYDQQINQIYKTVLNKPSDASKRMAQASRYFLGKPYFLGALGEGPDAEFDKGPLYRTDAFDCTTFVETTLALAQANKLEQFKTIIKKIRYNDGDISFINRNHFISVDWNINNARNGYIRDITTQFPAPYKIANTWINEPNWYQKLSADDIETFAPLSEIEMTILLNKLRAESSRVNAVTAHTPYLPLSVLFSQRWGKLILIESIC